MKKRLIILVGVFTLVFGTIITATLMNNNVYAAETHFTDNEHVVINGKYKTNNDYLYSDSLFEENPNQYSYHMATASMVLADASETYVKKTNGVADYSDGAKTIKEVYTNIGFKNQHVSDSYLVKPGTDSIAYIIGSKSVRLNNGKNILVISTTVRSANYELEWVSNVTLGTSGEAQGFKEAAEQVTEGINNYIKNNNLSELAKKGNIAFWIQGYSRGGATANLTAKRLVDTYQNKGNKIYAYCLEAPQGGIKSEEKDNSDYRCIHNVINPHDLVPYVAPTKFGFKRYGVDHYLTTDTFDSNNLIKSRLFENNIADNVPASIPEPEIINTMKWELEILEPNEESRKSIEPYFYKQYEISIKATDIVEAKTSKTTDKFIKDFVDRLAKSTSRSEYVNKGLQQALRNFMEFINSGNKIDKFKDQFGWMDLTLLGADVIAGGFVEGALEVAEDFWYDILDKLHIKERTTKEIPLSDGYKDKLASSVRERVERKQEIKTELDKTYPGQSKQALEDIYNLVYYALGGFTGINDAISLYKNIENIFTNHHTTQVLAYLRSDDGWYRLYTNRPSW